VQADTELIALGVSHDKPPLSKVLHRRRSEPCCPQSFQTGDLCIEIADQKIKVQPILGSLGLGDALQGEGEALSLTRRQRDVPPGHRRLGDIPNGLLWLSFGGRVEDRRSVERFEIAQ
jgi:hypothetical protein